MRRVVVFAVLMPMLALMGVAVVVAFGIGREAFAFDLFAAPIPFLDSWSLPVLPAVFRGPCHGPFRPRMALMSVGGKPLCAVR